MILKASLTWAAVAPPPTSRKKIKGHFLLMVRYVFRFLEQEFSPFFAYFLTFLIDGAKYLPKIEENPNYLFKLP